jgi:16S rRNA (cytosine967-C5)-methyltransferase
VQWRPDRRRTDPARLAAYDILRLVAEKDAYANLAAADVLGESGLTGRDAAFATELAYGTLRQRRWLDAVLAACVDRPLAEIDPPLLDVLRLGAYQLLALHTPPHAAVGETVQLARLVGGESRSRLVNAVLRKVSANDADGWVDVVAPDPGREPLQHLAIVRSCPDWIVAALADALRSDGMPGLDALEDLLIADNEPGPLTLCARPGRADVAELLAVPDTEPGRWSPYAVQLLHGAPGSVAAVRQQRAGVQDEASQLVALALARAPIEGQESAWLDLCAGPGGKAALLAGLAAPRGVALLAADRSRHRAGLVRRALPVVDAPDGSTRDRPAGPPADAADRTERTGVVVADGTAGPWRSGTFDRVLVDAPCTGLGVLRRRAEARWRRTPADVEQLVALQRRLLAAALDAVRVGGVVGYATCTPHLAETTGVVDEAVARGGVQRLDVRALLPEVESLGAGPDLRLWPHVHGTDGMYLALLRRLPPSG